MGMPLKDLCDQKFGKLTVIRRVLNPNAKHGTYWECRCECGGVVVARGDALKGGYRKSCRCLYGESHSTHGMTNTPEFRAWTEMLRRCSDQNRNTWHLYGGRGIRVCKRWVTSFEAFYVDMGERPSAKHSLDRIKVNGNYTPENCRWATKVEQQNNMRRNKRVNFCGRIMTLHEAMILSGCQLSKNKVRGRLNCGWDIKKALGL